MFESKISFLPVLDPFHYEKSSRNKITDHKIKLGEKSDIITKNKLLSDLNLNSKVLNDKTLLGTMMNIL